MKKLIALSIIMVLFLAQDTFAQEYTKEYTRIIGKILNIDTKNSMITIKIYSEVCRGIHTIAIENGENLKNIKVNEDIDLYLIRHCDKALIGKSK